MWSLHLKLKNTVSKLRKWYKNTLGNVYDKYIRLEEEISKPDIKIISDNNDVNRTNRNKIKAEYMRYLKIQDSIQRKKARVKWLTDRNSNTKYFHSVIKDKRRRTNIHKIENEFNHWVESTSEMSKAVVSYFKGILSQDIVCGDYSELDITDPISTKEYNSSLTAISEKEEIREVVFSMDPDSSPCTDGFSAKFFQTFCDIVSFDPTMALRAFFCSANLPK